MISVGEMYIEVDDAEFDFTFAFSDEDDDVICKTHEVLEPLREEMRHKYWYQYRTYSHGIPETFDIKAFIKDRNWWETKFEEARDIMTSMLGDEQDYTEYDIFRSTFVDGIDRYRKQLETVV